MKALIKSVPLREAMTFAGILGITLLLSTLFAEPSFAGLISPSDQPGAIGDVTRNEGDIRELTKTILNFFLGFLGFVATIMVIYGGGLYVVSAGNDESVGKAKKILLYAVIGIIIILISFALINTILGAATGDTVAML
jgi:hypothetical protein